ncbi:MAG: hypothetical protein A2X47_09940 [Lentisphaerae bacterium GWF2_38_69]|nr:MAG: hypothetical protein A2X47_09940 [Lentisphaerae bacterium GWF2_38_69]
MYTSMNKAFSDIVKEFGSYELSRKKFDFNPNFDIKETAHGYDIKAELSGMDEKDVEVSLEDNVLRISGEKKEEVSDKKGKNHISERRFGSFERAFTLPTEGDSSKIKASFSKGILSIHVPKTQRAKIHSKKIDIKAE